MSRTLYPHTFVCGALDSTIKLSENSEVLYAPRKPCGAERDRTDDLRLAKPALSQLSYSPVAEDSIDRRPPVAMRHAADRVGQGRLELPTSRLSGVRSNHLSYWPGVRHGCPAEDDRRRSSQRIARSLETELYACTARDNSGTNDVV
jgi:hypothetical protein